MLGVRRKWRKGVRSGARIRETPPLRQAHATAKVATALTDRQVDPLFELMRRPHSREGPAPRRPS